MARRVFIGVESMEESRRRGLEVARRVDRGEAVGEADYYLSFASAAQLFSELTPARLVVLERLKGSGPQSINALARSLGRNYSNVYRDVHRLMAHDLVARNERGQVLVPWDEVSIQLTLGEAAA
jgi:predicted transcriptional regulator